MGPKIEQWTTPIVFELEPLFFQGLLVTYEPTKSWNEFFIWGPVLGPGPKRAPKLKKWTPPTVFELGPSFFQGLLVTHEQTESRNRFLYLGPRFGARPQRAPQKWIPPTIFFS